MTSPLVNLKKTSLASEKIIYDLGSRHKEINPLSIEQQVYCVRRNTLPEYTDKEIAIINMTERLAYLENEMKGVKKELFKALEVINRKDAEISILKQLLSQQNEPVQSPMPIAVRSGGYIYEQYNDGTSEYPDGCFCDIPNLDWKEKCLELASRVAEMEVTDQRSVPYEVPKKEDLLFSGPGYRLGTHSSPNEDIKQIQVFFQFDMDKRKNQSVHKVSTKKTMFRENYFIPNESMHDGLYNVAYKGRINKREESEHMLDRSSNKPTKKQNLKKYIGSKDKSIKSNRDQKIVISEKPTINIKNKSVKFYCPVDSQSAPVLRHDENKRYYPTRHPQGKGYEVNYDNVSDDDNTPMHTLYDDSYGGNNNQQNIYDSTTKLVESRPKRPGKSPFEDDEDYEHMIIIGRKHKMDQREKINGNNEPYANEARLEGKKRKSTGSIGSENIKDMMSSVTRRSTLDDSMIQEGQELNSRIKGKNAEKTVKSLPEGQEGKAHEIPSSDKISDEQAKSKIKSSVPDEDNSKTTPAVVENDIEEFIDKRSSLPPVVIQANKEPTKSEGNYDFNSNELPSEGKEQRTHVTPSSDKTLHGPDEPTKAVSEKDIEELIDKHGSQPSVNQAEEELRQSKEIDSPDVSEISEGEVQTQNMVLLNYKTSDKKVKSSTEKEGNKIDPAKNTEYDDAYGHNTNVDSLEKVRRFKGFGDMFQSNADENPEIFELENKLSHLRSRVTSEYRDAYSPKAKYIIHQCSTNAQGQELHCNPLVSDEPSFQKLFLNGKGNEPNVIPLNNKTSVGQIELNMKSYNGNEIYSAFLYPDNSISKIWPLTKLDSDEFVVAVDDKVLNLNVPLKNYNINGDVTLNIKKRKPNFLMKEEHSNESDILIKNFDYDVEDLDEEDYFSGKVDYEDGYSS